MRALYTLMEKPTNVLVKIQAVNECKEVAPQTVGFHHHHCESVSTGGRG